MYRLLATDIDDTILSLDGSLPRETGRALQALHQAGIIIVFSSGRATSSLRAVASTIIQASDDEYLIAYNGGRVSTASTDRVIFEEPLGASLVGEIMQYTRRAGLHVQGYESDSFFVERHESTLQKWIDYYVKSTKMSWHYVDDLSADLPRGSMKLLIIGENGRLRELQKQLQPVVAGRFNMVFSKPIYLEVVASQVNKGRALKLLAGHLDIPLDDCIAFGDSSNDIEMLQTAGLGVAVANAREDVRKVADIVLERSADEAALLELVERYFPQIDIIDIKD